MISVIYHISRTILLFCKLVTGCVVFLASRDIGNLVQTTMTILRGDVFHENQLLP